MLISIAIAAFCLLPDGPGPDLATLTTIMDRLHGDLRGVEHAYRVERIKVDDREAGLPPTAISRGRFAARADDALQIAAETSFSDPSREPARESTRWPGGGVSNTNFEPDPIHFQLSARLLAMLRNPADFAVDHECLGWENEGDRRRLTSKFPIGKWPGLQDDFWIDMDRGGVPLRPDQLAEGQVLSRVEGVELARFPAGEGREAWLPVRGVYRTSVTGILGRSLLTAEKPNFEATLTVTPGTVFVNPDLPDRRFAIFPKPKPRAEASPIQK